MSGNEAWNRNVFKRWREVDRDGADITLSGRLFHMSRERVVRSTRYVTKCLFQSSNTKCKDGGDFSVGRADRQTDGRTDTRPLHKRLPLPAKFVETLFGRAIWKLENMALTVYPTRIFGDSKPRSHRTNWSELSCKHVEISRVRQTALQSKNCAIYNVVPKTRTATKFSNNFNIYWPMSIIFVQGIYSLLNVCKPWILMRRGTGPP